MQIERRLWTSDRGWQAVGRTLDGKAQLVLYFAAPGVMAGGARLAEMRARFPDAHLVGCTTGGEILGNFVYDGTVVLAALRFDHATVKVVSQTIADRQSSFAVGQALAADLIGDHLAGVLVLSDGINVNGSELVRGLKSLLPSAVPLTGGLAGDGAAFGSTQVGADNDPQPNVVAAIGFYGEGLRIHHGSFGGWDPFGPERLITRSEENVLYEIDGEPALDLYRRYLGEEARNLPGSALLFPLRIRPPHDLGTDLVRTVVGIDDERKAMIFAGDVPTGHVTQLMRGNFDSLIDGAGQAATLTGGNSGLAILISCIGRKLLLGQRIDEEVEAVSRILGENSHTIGFYSYGEISPHGTTASCELHNQTMTITLIDEC